MAQLVVSGEVLKLALDAYNDLVAAKADGKVDLGDVVKMVADLAPEVIKTVEDAKNIVAELKGATVADVQALFAQVPQTTKAGKVVAATVVALEKTKDTVDAVKEVIADLKA